VYFTRTKAHAKGPISMMVPAALPAGVVVGVAIVTPVAPVEVSDPSMVSVPVGESVAGHPIPIAQLQVSDLRGTHWDTQDAERSAVENVSGTLMLPPVGYSEP